jgi:hypothetical protein
VSKVIGKGVPGYDAFAEVQNLLRFAGGHGSVKARIGRAAALAGFDWERARKIWYGDRRYTIRPDEVVKARRAALMAAKDAANEYRELTSLIARLEASLRVLDAEFHEPSIDAMRAVAGVPRSGHLALADGHGTALVRDMTGGSSR